jgi:DNA-binding MarR family transcriptional regulator
LALMDDSIKQENNNSEYSDYNLWILMDHARVALSRTRELELAPLNLTPEQVSILHTIYIKGGSATNSEIADVTLRQYNSVCTMVNRLVKQGLVKKQKSAQDRKYIIVMTPKGKSKFEKITKASIEMAFSGLSVKDKQKMGSYLETIIDNSRRMLGMDFKHPFLNK